MPTTRCLGCNRLFERTRGKRGRCEECRLALKARRSAQVRVLGPCPQDARCVICGKVGTEGRRLRSGRPDKMTWHHTGVPHVQGGTEFAPAHLSCNSRVRDRG